MIYRPGLRISAAIQRRGDQLDFKRFHLWLARLRGGRSSSRSPAMSFEPTSATSPPGEDNLPWLFVSERGQPMTRQAVNYIVRLAGDKAKLGRVWPHMLRHSCGYYLADQGTACAPCRTILGTATASIPRTTPVSPGVGSKPC